MKPNPAFSADTRKAPVGKNGFTCYADTKKEFIQRKMHLTPHLGMTLSRSFFETLEERTRRNVF